MNAPDEAASTPRRVLHCYSGNLFGGLEGFLITLARDRELAPEWEPEFALCFEGRLRQELQAANALVHDLGAVRFRHPWTVWQARRRLARVLSQRRPDLVVCHECWAYALGAPVARQAGLPLVFWAHSTHEGGRWYERLTRRTPPDLVLFDSQFLRQTDPLFPDVKRRAVLYYPVPPLELGNRPDIRARVRQYLETPESAVVILLASRLSPYKGQELLLEALGRLRDDRRWILWLAGGVQQAGEAAFLARLQTMAEERGIADRVRFLGERSDVPALLAAADLHCQPNLGPEPFGIAFVEALYAGLPVVTTRLGGGAEIVNGACGVLVPPADPDALAEALATLIANPERRTQLGAAGPDRARALCDPVPTFARISHTLLDLLEERPRANVVPAETTAWNGLWSLGKIWD